MTTLAELEAEAAARMAKGEWATAIADVTKVSANAKSWPQAMQDRLEACKDKVVASAKETLTRIEGAASAGA